MMFVQYPSLSRNESLNYMAELDLSSCCEISEASLINHSQFESFVIEQRPYGPQLKLHFEGGIKIFNTRTGALITDSSRSARSAYANQIAATAEAGPARSLGKVDIDQWSLIPKVAKHAPFEIFELNNSDKTHLYFSTVTGELVQQVSFTERTWGWVGAVVHWIYPTMIRSNTKLWVQLVIWLSVVSLFMVVVGAVLGVVRLRHRGRWRKSPYRGRFFWHHYTGLFCGVFMLTWLFSGLMSMYPWGLMEGRNFDKEIRNLRGSEFYFTPEIQNWLKNISRMDMPDETVKLRGVIVAGYLNLFTTNIHNDTKLLQRLPVDESENLFPSPDQIAKQMRPDINIISVDMLESSDRYYYSHHEHRKFPVYRFIYQDGERIYLDATTNEVVAFFDSSRKTARWLYLGLHRGDFFPSLNGGLIWYIAWGGLLLCMTIAVGIGCWLALRCWQRLLAGKKRSSNISVRTT